MNDSTQLYRHFDKNGVLLYVGISLCTVQRLSQHGDGSHWFYNIAHVTIETFPTRSAAVKAEKHAIKTERPLHNLAHVDKTKPVEPSVGLVWGAKEIAKVLGRSEKAAFATLERGQIPGARRFGRRWCLNLAVFMATFEDVK